MYIFLVIVVFSASFVAILPAVTPAILNRIKAFENDTFKKQLAYEIEYFVDQDEHYWFPFLHFLFSSVLMSFAASAIGVVYITCMYYSIGTFKAVW